MLWCAITPAFGSPNKAIAVVFSGSRTVYQKAWEHTLSTLRAKGNCPAVIEYNLAEQSPDHFNRIIEENRPDAVLVFGTRAAQIVKERYADIPMVFAMVLDPNTIRTPHSTGILMDISVNRQLDFAKRIVPKAKRVGIFYSPATRGKFREISDACRDRGFILTAWQINDRQDIPEAIRNIAGKVDCFLMIPDSTIFFHESVRDLLMAGLTNRIAIIGLSSYFTETGTLFSLECDYTSIGKQAAELIQQVLNGAEPSDIAPEKPDGVTLTLNRTVADRLGIEFPPDIQQNAKHIFGR